MLLYRGESRFDLGAASVKLPLILRGQERLIIEAKAKAKPRTWRYAGELRQMINVPTVGAVVVRSFPINFDEKVFINPDPVEPAYFVFVPPNWMNIRVTIVISDLISATLQGVWRFMNYNAIWTDNGKWLDSEVWRD